jgi:uncharacterized OB-fold protein
VAQLNVNTIRFPYRRSLGPVFGAFLTGLTERKILGIRSGARVIVPPLEWDPDTAAQLDVDLVEVGPAGTVTSWTWVGTPSASHPLDRPFAFALSRMAGADTAIMHAVDAGSIDAIQTGSRVAPRWRARRIGYITDIECFVLGEEPQTPDDDAGPAAEPVTMMDFDASLTYHDPTGPSSIRAAEAGRRGQLLGHTCPVCGNTYQGGRGACPIDSTEFGPEHDVVLSNTGVVTNYTVVTPTQYPGQTETEPFARCMIAIDSHAVVLGYQWLIDVPVTEVRSGMHVTAIWASPTEQEDMDLSTGQGNVPYLVGWMPTGEPDVDDPDLVNRIH